VPVEDAVKAFAATFKKPFFEPIFTFFVLLRLILPLLSGVALKEYLKRALFETRRLFGDVLNDANRASGESDGCGPGGGGGGGPGGGGGRNGSRSEARVHLVVPQSFNDVKDVADKFKDSIPVIINLQGADSDLVRRLVDFGSGLTYALDGGMQKIADKVFLLTPRNVEVSAEERARILEKGFYNQS